MPLSAGTRIGPYVVGASLGAGGMGEVYRARATRLDRDVAILIKNYAVSGSGNQRTITADVEWTFPMAFMEVVTGDGKTVAKQVLPAADLQAFGSKKLSIPFDVTGKKWVRFAMWDVAGNGAFTQPQWLAEAKVTK